MNWKDVASSPYSFKGVMKVYTADGKTYIKLWESNKESGDGQMAVHVELDNSTGTSGRGLSVPFYDINNDTSYAIKIEDLNGIFVKPEYLNDTSKNKIAKSTIIFAPVWNKSGDMVKM